ncbi:hypothetical protein SteCoe_35108 [Stentor coeruleus]|uniref:SP-RING-type domain-containing protein n=1 Tax=Stentor coeruleus TaxID=5963 RepID=A0A1R2AT75_9CILI|nr:hypothetical protein SteCoe_35108 [Stentor coeruleus]
MEAFSDQTTQILNNYHLDSLRQIMKRLNDPATKKPEMIQSIINYLSNPENLPSFSIILPPELIRNLSSVLPDRNLKCICNKFIGGDLISCNTCHKKQHISCIGNLSVLLYYECIICMMRKINPADEVKEFLIEPYLIAQESVIKKFNYSKVLKNEIFSNQSGIEIQLRCVKLQMPGYSISWPKQASLIVNKKLMKEFKESPNQKRKDSALDLTIAFSLGTNEISLVKKNDGDSYALAVVKVKKLPIDKIFRKMSASWVLKNKCVEFIKAKFTDDNEIEQSSVKLNMKCPYTLKTIKTPVRGKECSHLSCFDLQTFIDIQRYESYTWKCPICKGFAYEVYVDKFIEEVLLKCSNTDRLEAIQLKSNCEYTEIISEEEDLSLKRKNPEAGYYSDTDQNISETMADTQIPGNIIIQIDD